MKPYFKQLNSFLRVPCLNLLHFSLRIYFLFSLLWYFRQVTRPSSFPYQTNSVQRFKNDPQQTSYEQVANLVHLTASSFRQLGDP